MQVESNFLKYAGRVPPLDLSQVSANCRNENELQQLWSSKAANSPSVLKRAAALTHPYLQSPHTPAHSPNSPNSNNNNTNSHNNNNNNNHNNFNTILSQHTSLQQMGSDGLPLDPRDWTRADVWKWLINMAVSEGLEVTPELPQKFPMNGKALCLMSLDMYLCRVPVGGKMLYRDFRVRLARAMALLS
ncbi:PREDICTED: bifunctional serine/threonine-protein kinase/NEDD4-like E3 ubiquitin-protein ligase [Rhagoletis zephyria]|uniref:bifunctional serine/threonine-protein kinase/NEDD4-like E3 ubiquitin-protein ligase n=1 Tax=Rhagoletis zephyria TaxID=28612 RepID=UPI0008119926|nr:PREDICTED: bifunctional serine/threonine-protein kinase/NEDD4-like E3 ubiquitin-protein ligase [Rhagoletis zephyria]